MKKLLMLAALAALCGCKFIEVEDRGKEPVVIDGKVVLVDRGWKVKQNSHWTNSEVDGINASIDKNGVVSFALAGAKSSPSEEFNKTMLTYTAMFTEMARIAAAAYNPSSSGVAAAKTAEPAQTVVNVQPAASATTTSTTTNAVTSADTEAK
jgi:cytochrome oxidase assembly protein ShyY1